MSHPNNTLSCFEYDGEYFDVEFTDNGHVEKIMMYACSGMLADLFDVTSLMNDVFKEKAEEKFRQVREENVLHLADRHNDDKKSDPPGAA